MDICHIPSMRRNQIISNVDLFIVTLLNRSVATPSQTSMENVESIESVESVHSTSLIAKELAAFKERLKELPLTSSTKDCTAELFRRYGFEYTFHAVNVADVFNAS